MKTERWWAVHRFTGNGWIINSVFRSEVGARSRRGLMCDAYDATPRVSRDKDFIVRIVPHDIPADPADVEKEKG